MPLLSKPGIITSDRVAQSQVYRNRKGMAYRKKMTEKNIINSDGADHSELQGGLESILSAKHSIELIKLNTVLVEG